MKTLRISKSGIASVVGEQMGDKLDEEIITYFTKHPEFLTGLSQKEAKERIRRWLTQWTPTQQQLANGKLYRIRSKRILNKYIDAIYERTLWEWAKNKDWTTASGIASVVGGDDQLAKGIEVEKEHLSTLTNLYMAGARDALAGYHLKFRDHQIELALAELSSDHLREIPDYYDRLEQMEREAKR